MFVGSMPSGEYSNEIKAEIWKATNINSISITGFVEQQEYIDYMAAADLAVQLRQDSRGETSAAVFDCLSAGLPVICNNHGFIKEISNKAVMKISENFDMTELQLMLEKAFFDKKTTMQFACNAKADIDHNNNNTEVGRKYHAAIEYFYECQKNSLPVGSMLDGLGRLDSQVIINSGSCELKKILIDISAIVRHDLKTGIERVVRSIVNELLTNPRKVIGLSQYILMKLVDMIMHENM
ncbi:glycosyltransferase [Vogesella fluminis]|uniref:glycosyltransferase n=1 Tax=Vogesella fluminis TaxID=1069161 RepID=UPI00363D1002